MEVARGEPIVATDLNGPPLLSASPRAGQDRFAIFSSFSKQPRVGAVSFPPCGQAAAGTCSVNSTSRRQTAQTMRASLLARAIAALL